MSWGLSEQWRLVSAFDNIAKALNRLAASQEASNEIQTSIAKIRREEMPMTKEANVASSSDTS